MSERQFSGACAQKHVPPNGTPQIFEPPKISNVAFPTVACVQHEMSEGFTFILRKRANIPWAPSTNFRSSKLTMVVTEILGSLSIFASATNILCLQGINAVGCSSILPMSY